MSNKPLASLTSQEVHEIVTELDNLILAERMTQDRHDVLTEKYRTAVHVENGYLRVRNLILEKI